MRWFGITRMPNRTVCQVLEEMRKLNETRNYSSLLSLIEEAQSMVNRMESKLYTIKDYEHMVKEEKRLRREVDTLRSIKDDSK